MDFDRADQGGVDRHVGARIAAMRETRGLTVDGLADHLEVTPQQVEAYETGRQRVTASRLFAIGEALEAPPSEFFQGLGGEQDRANNGSADGLRKIIAAWPHIRPERQAILVDLACKLAAETREAD